MQRYGYGRWSREKTPLARAWRAGFLPPPLHSPLGGGGSGRWGRWVWCRACKLRKAGFKEVAKW
jgi:hypothetical protein